MAGYFVTMKDDSTVDLEQTALDLTAIFQKHGCGEIKETFSLGGVFVVEGANSKALEAIRQLPQIAAVEPEPRMNKI